MRIGIVSPYDMGLPGGVQTQVRGLVGALQTLGDEVRVIAPGRQDDGEFVSVGRSMSIPANRSRAPVALGRRVPGRVREAAQDLDLLHVHEPFMPLTSWAALRAGPPVVATFHAAPSRFGRRLYRVAGSRVRELLGPHVRRVTAVSRTAAEVLPDVIDVEIVPNGLDVAAFTHFEERVPGRVVFLGRDEPRKGLDVLLRAWGQVVAAEPEANLVVMGVDRGTGEAEWLGTVDDDEKARVLSTAQIYVAPNLGGESFGIVVLEGMAAGAAVVASDLPAFRQVGGEAALYFPTGDGSMLASTLIALLADERRCDEFAMLGRARAAEFDWARVAARYRAIYVEALS